ncbi:MAG: hypothetical protein WKF43_14510 [Acidimicrobiales bacterium]
MSEVDGCRSWAWVHGSWAASLGPAEVDDGAAVTAMRSYARACATTGRPADPSALTDVLPPAAVAAVRATVAQVEVANLVGHGVDGLVSRLTRRRPLHPLAALGEVMAAAAAMPVAVPLLAGAGLWRAVTRLAPPPSVVVEAAGDEPNLLVHLLVETLRTHLANAAVRVLLLAPPVPVAVALRSGPTSATVRFGQGRIAVLNGVTDDALVVIDGDVEPLVRNASRALGRELAALLSSTLPEA